jgi:hypothetical protein
MGYKADLAAIRVFQKTTIPKIQLLNPDEFIEHGTVEELQQYCKMDVKVFLLS